jgi:prepilin-type N-terminal cleavage/methylation domain-containing protein
MTRRGFTLIEVTIALVIGGMALSAAAALLTGLSHRAEQIRVAAARVDRDGNGERLLRSLLENLRFSSDTTQRLRGDSTAVTFLTRCETAEGWLRPCSGSIAVDPSGTHFQIRLVLNARSTQSLALSRVDRGSLSIRYLRDAETGGHWATRWSELVTPMAIELIAGTDTLLLPTW